MTAETFADLLALVVPAGDTEETWALRKRLAPRTVRRAKARTVRLQAGTLRTLALAMPGLGGTLEERVARIRAATAQYTP